MMFAQTATNSEIGTWMVVAGFIVNLIVGVFTLIKMNGSQKRDVSLVGDCADKEDNIREHVALKEQMEKVESDLHTRITGVAREAQNKLDNHKSEENERFDKIQETLRKLPGEIISTLKNAGGLS